MKRPWYTYPNLTRAFLNQISTRYDDINELRDVLNYLTERLWAKNEQYILKGGTKQ